jgi:hypothetical protein
VNLTSDIIGLLAGFFLMLPAAKENVYRFIEARNRQKEAHGSWPGLRRIVAEGWRTKRDAYSPLDTLWILLGGAGLMVSFALKLASA